MTWDYIAHIVRDTFGQPKTAVYYGIDIRCIPTFRKPEHGIETWGIYSGRPPLMTKNVHEWVHPHVNDTYHGEDFADLFLSINYRPEVAVDDTLGMAKNIRTLIKPDGFAFIVNPSYWADDLHEEMVERDDLVHNIQSYHMFYQEDVRVFQK